MKKTLLIISFILSISASAQIYVNASATGANNGTSWADAYTDLNDALANDAPGDEIWIAAGTYTPGTTITSLFSLNQNGVSLYGGFNGTESMLSERDPSINITILSGDLNSDDTGVEYSGANRSDNSARVLVINNPDCLIDGLTITGGHAVGTTGTVEEGSAIYINNANFTIKNCTISDNVVSRGGVIRAFDRFGNLEIEETKITGNLGEFATALYARATNILDIELVNCLISGNRKEGGTSVTPALMWFRQDAAGVLSASLVNCTVVDNSSVNAPSTVAISATLDNTVNASSELRVYNSIFQNNTAVSGTTSSLMNSMGNGTGTPSANVYDVRHSLDESGFTNITNNGSSRINVNNLSGNPSFTSNIDFTLAAGSTAIDAGNNSFIPNGVLMDLVGNNRIAGSSVDMGAYESSSSPAPSRPIVYVDINASGNNDGTSWTNAFTTLENALTLGTGRQIWVASGTYKRPSNVSRAFIWDIPADTFLYGGFNGTETMASERDHLNNPTILSGDANGDDNFNLEYGVNASSKSDNNQRLAVVRGADVIIDGLTFTGAHCFGNITEGAALTIAIDTKVSNCVFENNVAERAGAAIRIYDINGINQSHVNTITNCIIRKNRAWFASGVYSLTTVGEHKLELLGCSFEDNITGLTSQGNNPAGIVWLRNEASNNVQSDFDAINCTIAGNSGTYSGTAYPHFRLSKLSGSSEYRAFNNIFWNNPQTVNGSASNTRVFGVSGGSRNFSIDTNIDERGFSNLSSTATNTSTVDPLFLDPSNGDYRLSSTSPAVGGGDTTYPTSGVDYFGFTRIINNAIDLGAFTSQATASMDSIEEIRIKLYPNPATNRVNLDCGDLAFAKAEIYNSQGQFLKSVKQSTIDVTDLDSGIYFIKVFASGGENNTIKMIKG